VETNRRAVNYFLHGVGVREALIPQLLELLEQPVGMVRLFVPSLYEAECVRICARSVRSSLRQRQRPVNDYRFPKRRGNDVITCREGRENPGRHQFS